MTTQSATDPCILYVGLHRDGKPDIVQGRAIPPCANCGVDWQDHPKPLYTRGNPHPEKGQGGPFSMIAALMVSPPYDWPTTLGIGVLAGTATRVVWRGDAEPMQEIALRLASLPSGHQGLGVWAHDADVLVQQSAMPKVGQYVGDPVRPIPGQTLLWPGQGLILLEAEYSAVNGGQHATWRALHDPTDPFLASTDYGFDLFTITDIPQEDVLVAQNWRGSRKMGTEPPEVGLR